MHVRYNGKNNHMIFHIQTCVVMLDNTLSRTLVSGSEMTRVVSGAIESTFVSSNKFIIKLDFIINLQPIKKY